MKMYRGGMLTDCDMCCYFPNLLNFASTGNLMHFVLLLSFFFLGVPLPAEDQQSDSAPLIPPSLSR